MVYKFWIYFFSSHLISHSGNSRPRRMSLLYIKMTQKLYLVLFMKFFSLFFILMLHTTQLFPSCTSVFFLKLNQSIFYLSDNECSFTTNRPYFAITVSNKYYVFSIFTIYITYMVYLYIYMVIKKNLPYPFCVILG